MGTFIESLAAFEKAVNAVMDEVGRTEPMVRICFSGRKTVAELVKNGRVVKSADARCNPKDTYSRAEGAKIAVERLFAKKEKLKPGDKFIVAVKCGKSCHNFKIGSVVVLSRVWDDRRLELVDKSGLRQVLYRDEVRPYKETSK